MIEKIVQILTKTGLSREVAIRIAQSIDRLYADQESKALRDYWKVKKRESRAKKV
jgi:hypothetical protein